MQNQIEHELNEGAAQHHTEHAITIETPASVVFEVLTDVEGYVRLFPQTRSVTILEEGDSYQLTRLVVDVKGEDLSWVSRRDLDRERKVIAYRQLETAPLLDNMGGEWRCLPLDERRTQLVITHDFSARRPADGRMTFEEAENTVLGAVDRNSNIELVAVKAEAERRYHRNGR